MSNGAQHADDTFATSTASTPPLPEGAQTNVLSTLQALQDLDSTGNPYDLSLSKYPILEALNGLPQDETIKLLNMFASSGNPHAVDSINCTPIGSTVGGTSMTAASSPGCSPVSATSTALTSVPLPSFDDSNSSFRFGSNTASLDKVTEPSLAPTGELVGLTDPVFQMGVPSLIDDLPPLSTVPETSNMLPTTAIHSLLTDTSTSGPLIPTMYPDNNRLQMVKDGGNLFSSSNMSSMDSLPAISPVADSTNKKNELIKSSMRQHADKKLVPAFLRKLYSMVEDPANHDIIDWAEDGSEFVIKKADDLAKTVLPKFFKHNNFSSFVRQLNMYGFHKVPHITQGALENTKEADIWRFSHQNFHRDHPEWLVFVSRKKRDEKGDEKAGSESSVTISAQEYHNLLRELEMVKHQQIEIQKLVYMKNDFGKALYSEIDTLRKQYQRQKTTITQIIQFLASFISGDRTLASGLVSALGGMPNTGAMVPFNNTNQGNTSTALMRSNNRMHPNAVQDIFTVVEPSNTDITGIVTPQVLNDNVTLPDKVGTVLNPLDELPASVQTEAQQVEDKPAGVKRRKRA